MQNLFTQGNTNLRLAGGGLVLAVLNGCGGGGGDQATLPVVDVKGVIAVGAPVAGAVVSATCGTWHGNSKPSDSMGIYTIQVPSKPCIISTLVVADGTTLHSFVTASGTSNLTLFTEAIYQVAGGNVSNIETANTKIQRYLSAMGIDAGTNPITIEFAANSTGHDRALDRFSQLIVSTPQTGAGSTSQNNLFINSVAKNSQNGGNMSSPSVVDRLINFGSAWNLAWSKIGASDQVYGSAQGVKKFIAEYSTKYSAKLATLPQAFNDLTEKQITNIASFVNGWKTCGYQDSANTSSFDCTIGRISAVIVDLGYNWVGTAAKTAVDVVVVGPVNEVTSASFDMYRSITNSMYDAELESGNITQEDHDWIIEVNNSAANYARVFYDTISTAIDAKDAIKKVNTGYANLKKNFSGKNATRISTWAKLRNPFKKMLSGVNDGHKAFKGSTSNWSDADKVEFQKLIALTADDFLNSYFGPEAVAAPIVEGLTLVTPAKVGTTTTFNITGTNLPVTNHLDITFDGCANIQFVSQSAAQHQFTCTPSTAGTITAVIRTSPGATPIGSFPILVSTGTLLCTLPQVQSNGACVTSINIPATSFVNGLNVALSTNGYGSDTLMNAPPYGSAANAAEWIINVPSGRYELFATYASELSRPVTIYFDGTIVFTNALASVTGGFFSANRQTLSQGIVQLPTGASVMRVTRGDVFPHIKGFTLVPLN